MADKPSSFGIRALVVTALTSKSGALTSDVSDRSPA
jgi:hypothetical protein